MKKLCALLCGMVIMSMSSTFVSAAQSIIVKLDGNNVSFGNIEPVVKDNRTLIPLRGLFEKMGYSIDWEPNTKAAILLKDGNTISIRSEKKYIIVNNIQKNIDVPAQIINGSMMIPLRAVADATGAKVNWNGDTKTVEIITGNQNDYIISINEYTKKYNNAIKDLELLEKVAGSLNSLNSNNSESNVNKILSQLNEAKMTISDTIDKVEELTPPEEFVDYHSLSLEAMNKQTELCDVLKAALTGSLSYEKASDEITDILNAARDIDSRLKEMNLSVN